jgi:hypothetical protein
VTNPYNDNIVIKLIPVESTTTGRTESDIQELVARIQVEDLSPPPFNIRPDGLEVEARYRAAAERLWANPRINREGGEFYLDVDPLRANNT